jgi:nucleoside phosphorylase
MNTGRDIKVLLVEDDPGKLSEYLKLLADSGVASSQTEVAQNGLDARDKLRTTRYNLMILDLALPMRSGENPASSAGVDLLDELADRPGYYRPSHIVGVTAYEELSNSFEEAFADRMLILLHYDPGSERWRSQLMTLLHDLQRVEKAQAPAGYGKDVCIVTALRDPELLAIRDLPYGFGQARLLDNITYFHEGVLETAGEAYSIVASAAPSMGLVPAALHASKLVNEFRPRLLIMTGICAGVSGKVNPGDIILANPAWEWQSGKRVVVDGEVRFQSDPRQLDVDRSITARFEQMMDDPSVWAGIMGGWRGTKPATPLKGVIGPLASGSVVAADGTTIRDIQQTQHRKLVGLEMEIYGVYAAAREFPANSPLTFALKAVSDLADAEKTDDYQSYAAYTSANATHHFLLRYIAELAQD